ncbi:putative nucleolar complex-associated protein [Ordospora pajunii]|jgi:nucleolar complex protein 3|uniref:putative nucleolar complex-associated protein n=1 Tax=Ordospora pajunii TaxID=3039483 RepID=UPI0029528C2E|nr:putative nucleolar complex-associated protein [Ordospora pajunii]KAH9411706.1 putative nucleolar complex-associated protein [Ordospora pajunii]
MNQKALQIASLCMEVINDPNSCLGRIGDVLAEVDKDTSDETRGLVYLSVLKVFKAIIPLYKVRTLKDVVKDKRESLHLKGYDKTLLKWYTAYVKMLVDDRSDASYVSLCELLKHFDHFNCTDKIVSRVLEGSVGNGPVPEMCCETIKLKMHEDWAGELIIVIINQMLDYDYNPVVLEYLLSIPLVDKSLKSDSQRASDYWRANRSASKKNEKEKIFVRKKLLDKKLRKVEKQRLIAQSEARDEEDIEGRIEEIKNCKKIHDAILRLYFTVLKSDRYDCYKSTFLGLVKYRKILCAEFMEGLYFLLCSNLDKLCSDLKIQAVKCVMILYGSEGYDFEKLVNAMYGVIYPMNMEAVCISEVVKATRLLFVHKRQPSHRARVFARRLMLYGCTRFAPEMGKLAKEISVVYDFEFSEISNALLKDTDIECTKVDYVPEAPFFEHFLLKQII